MFDSHYVQEPVSNRKLVAHVFGCCRRETSPNRAHPTLDPVVVGIGPVGGDHILLDLAERLHVVDRVAESGQWVRRR